MNATSPIPVTASGIACAKCSHWDNGRRVQVRHADLAAVKACSQGRSVEPDPMTVDRPYATPGTAQYQSVIRDNWTALEALAAKAEAENERRAYQAKMDRDDTLKATNPWPSKRDAIKPGRYAVVVDGEYKFYKIDRPTEGRWAGRTFVSVQASDELYPVRNRTAREEILNLIAVDPRAAMLNYGRELGKCGHCGRTLTDATSRANGIGPICAEKGW